MKEILLTSSALILALLILRRIFRNRISRRAQYALWLLVLVRLLVPVSLPGVGFSLLTAAEPVVQGLEADRSLYLAPVRETIIGPEGGDIRDNTPAPSVPVAVGQSSPDNTQVFTDDNNVVHQVEYQKQLELSTLLRWVWAAGMLLMGLWLLISNLRFGRKLRKARRHYSIEGCKYPVYLVEAGLSSPCLFGLVRPAIYLTPAAAESPERLRHVIAHESAHARHLDPLWALLRGVCLVVWWFNPLVWAAAAASKADGELACDEAALKTLGPAERVPYGQTLLSLIPVHKGPGDPLLSATTMTAGKRHLKDRITRIAQGGQTRAAALFLVLALAAVVCAVTFTGAKTQKTQPLTGDELAYFNEEFFNNDTVDSVVGVNIHNQFLTSLYERPEDIDLYELFYCGTGRSGEMTEEELRQVGSFDESGSQICPTDKLAVADLDAVLLENTGLTLAETAGTGLEQFQYLPEYDAYYHTHGDTNYFVDVNVVAGERSGNIVRLYYDRARTDSGWACVTLEQQSDGSFWFVSNQPAEKPIIPTVYPEGDPVLTIPLTDLEPYEPAPASVTHRSGDCAERGGGMLVNAEDGSQVSVHPYLSTDGNMYLAVIYDAAVGNGQMITWDVGCFFTFPESSLPNGPGSISLDSFSDLFGHSGVVVSYSAPDPVEAYLRSTIHNYYYFEDANTPVLLAQVSGTETAVVDLDGDGENELLTDGNQLFFQRDGQLYKADITQLLEDHWPEFVWWDYSLIDTSRCCLTVRGFMAMPDWGENTQCDFVRSIYFDGESLLVYHQLEDTVDHAAESVLSAGVPEQVLADAKAKVQSDFETATSGVLSGSIFLQPFDDWRVSYLNLTGTYTDYPTGPIEVYGVGYQFHAEAPANLTLAGGMYLQEDGWAGGFSTGSSPYLVYEVQADGSRTRLESYMAGDYSVDSPAYRADLCFTLMENGLVTWETLPGGDLYNMFWMNESTFLNNLAAGADGAAQETALAALVEYGSTYDPTGLQEGLQNLALSSSLTTAGLEAYERLLAAVAAIPTQAGKQVQAVLDQMSGAVTLTLAPADGAGGGSYEVLPDAYRAARLSYYPTDFRWDFASAAVPPEGTSSLTIRSADGTASLQCWQGSDLVRCTLQDETIWLTAPAADADDVYDGTFFSALRDWYDHLEWEALQKDLVIPDKGQSYLEIAQAWSDASARQALKVTSGSAFACTYVRTVAEVDSWTDMPETSYPDETEGHERFWFSYTRIFVPETQHALNYQMAGNTGNYGGQYGDAPEGAFENFQVGVLYKTEDGWRCDGTGTGP